MLSRVFSYLVVIRKHLYGSYLHFPLILDIILKSQGKQFHYICWFVSREFYIWFYKAQALDSWKKSFRCTYHKRLNRCPKGIRMSDNIAKLWKLFYFYILSFPSLIWHYTLVNLNPTSFKSDLFIQKFRNEWKVF